MRILWHSNAPWSTTGYANQTALFIHRLQDAGHDVALSAFYGLEGGPLTIGGIPIFPRSPMGGYGDDVLPHYAEQWGAEVVITLTDVWVLSPEKMEGLPWYPWLPVDHEPCPPVISYSLQAAVRPIAFSRFGERMLRDAGFAPLYVPHGVDTAVFQPSPDLREAWRVDPDTFVIGMVMANKGAPSRKAFDQQIRAVGIFAQRHPNMVLYMHTEMAAGDGENLWQMLRLSGLRNEQIRVVDQTKYKLGMLGGDYLARAYSTFDVTMNATRGEGFGIPIIEAQACGSPVIVTDFSSMPELVRSGWAVGHSDKYYYMDAYQVIPSVDDLVDALESAYNKRGDAAFRAQARAGIVADYDADHVLRTYWTPVLEQIAREQRDPRERAARLVTIGGAR